MKVHLLLAVLCLFQPLLTHGRSVHEKNEEDKFDEVDLSDDDELLPTEDVEEEGKELEKRRYTGRSYGPSQRITNSQTHVIRNDLDNLKDCEELVIPEHTTKVCNTYSGCRVTCEDDDYLFPHKNNFLVFVCSNGKWIADGTEFTSVPNCIPEEELDDDDTKESKCEIPVPEEHSRLNCPQDTYCDLRCHKGYKLPEDKNHIDLFCIDGKWTVEGSKEAIIPSCEPEEPACIGEPDIPSGSVLACNLDRTCEARCETGHKFPSGNSSVRMSCRAGVWVVESSEEDKTKGCVREMLKCGEKTINNLKNATVQCDEKSCTATCIPGHKFPSGNPTLFVRCKANKWEIPGTSLDFVPDCVEELKSHVKCDGSKYLVFPGLGAYKVNTTHVSWPDAQKTCIHEGGHLAVINSEEELDLIKKLIATHHTKNSWTYAHIGFSDLAKRKVWVTVLGKLLDSHFTKWAPRNPSNMDERCGAIDHLGRLHDIFCHSPQIFICEKM